MALTTVIAYDVSEDARRARLAALLQMHGDRIQFSVFLCRLDDGELDELIDAAERIIKLASNENPSGMSPKARVAVEAAIGSLERYPDDYDLKAALANRYGFGMERIVLGNGSNDVLDLIARVYLAPGRSAVLSQYAFSVYPLATISAGWRPLAGR